MDNSTLVKPTPPHPLISLFPNQFSVLPYSDPLFYVKYIHYGLGTHSLHSPTCEGHLVTEKLDLSLVGANIYLVSGGFDNAAESEHGVLPTTPISHFDTVV